MAVACASRFAVLKLEDDEIDEPVAKKPATQNNTQSKSKVNGKASVDNKNKPKKKKKPSSEINELQNLAFGSYNSKSKQKSANNGKANVANQKQWEEWKQKDNEFVSETYESDLQEAILQSKISFEEKKDIYDANQKEAEQAKLVALNKSKKKANKKKDKGIMSLDEFQNLDSNQLSSGNIQRKSSITELDSFDALTSKSPPPDESHFFDDIKEDAEKIILKESRKETTKTIEPVVESARLLQYQEDIRNKDEEITSLKENVKKLKEELKNVKIRNKKLYGILESGEMREKADILLQIEDLTTVKDELTEQVAEYHTSLEQERSRVHALQSELKKYQVKKQRLESK